MKTRKPIKRAPLRVFVCASALLLLQGCRSPAPVCLLSPRCGAVVATLSDAQKSFLEMPRDERVAKFADQDFRNALRDKAGYYPLPTKFEWALSDAVAVPPGGIEYEVEVVRLEPAEKVFFATNFVSSSITNSIVADNFEIARRYRWKVSAKALGAEAEGEFETEDMAPRLIRLPNIQNMRDLGGRIGLDGRRVKQGIVYRSAGINNNATHIYYTEKELAEIPEYREKVEDFRSMKALWDSLTAADGAAPLPLSLSPSWTLFLPEGDRDSFDRIAVPALKALDSVPEEFLGAKGVPLEIADGEMHAFDKETARGPAVLMQEIDAPDDGCFLLSAGGDYWWNLRSNGRAAFDLVAAGNWRAPYGPDNFLFQVPVKKGRNVIAVTLFTGAGGWAWGCKAAPGKTFADAAANLEEVREKIDSGDAFKVEKTFKKGDVRLTDASREYALEFLGIRSDIDLRSDFECAGMEGSPFGPQVEWFHYSSGCYSSMATKFGRDAFTEVFRVFLDERNYPIDFHCIAGQDRTGAVAFIINGLLGVPEEDLWLDWETTGFWNGSAKFNHERLFKRLLAVFDAYPGETVNERIEAYVLSLGFTKADIEKLRSIMLE